MRTRSIPVVLATLALGLAACTRGATAPTAGAGSDHVPPPAPAPRAPRDLLVLGSGNRLSAIDARTGAVVFGMTDAVPAPDWSALYETRAAGGRTVVETVDPTTGTTRGSISLRGRLAIRAVSFSGDELALTAPEVGPAWVPRARSSTTVSVADPSGLSKPETFRLRGNFEPEAFSSDGARLFMLQYTPALHPTSYHVVYLYLEKGKVFPVYGRNKAPVENMTATRLLQVPSSEGTSLYTLYSNQPPAYALGFDGAQASAGHAVAFIHTLSLDGGFAICVGLPEGFGSIPASAAALAAAPDGSHVYAIDAQHGQIAVLRTTNYRISQTAKVDLGRPGAGTFARVSADGSTLYVGTASGVYAFDAETLAPRGRALATSPVSGLALSPDGSRLYVSTAGRIVAIDPLSLGTTFEVPAAGVIEHVGAAA